MSEIHVGHFKLHIHVRSHKEDILGDIFLDDEKKRFIAHADNGFYENYTAPTAKEAVAKVITNEAVAKVITNFVPMKL